MIIQDRKITVIHLIWLPYGIGLFRQFLESYLRHEAGCGHTLFLVFNGVKSSAETDPYHEYAKEMGVQYNSIDIAEGQDLDCYFKTAALLETDYIMILNSFSAILADNWLKNYLSHFTDPATGLVGATASLQSYYSSVFQKNSPGWEAGRGVMHHFRKYKLFLKAFFYWRWLFSPFPNPHVRTNAFMIQRKLFLQLKHRDFVSKFAAYQFESGRQSMTNQVLEKGYRVLVVDRYGHIYAPADWKDSHTFWNGKQENLLVSDNQTGLYAEASKEEKKKMTWLAWGTT